MRQTISQQAHTALDPYAAAGMLRPFEGVTAVYPGIRAFPEPGHTVGHTAYSVESKGRKLLLWGDIIHSAEVQFFDPGITIQFDTNARDAIETRVRAFTEAAEQGYIVGGAHITFPGLGHVGVDDEVYSWVQLPYATL
jgi:glyoxylase-like metal-dependent hydrolase (beta-lactamase superfamily II)